MRALLACAFLNAACGEDTTNPGPSNPHGLPETMNCGPPQTTVQNAPTCGSVSWGPSRSAMVRHSHAASASGRRRTGDGDVPLPGRANEWADQLGGGPMDRAQPLRRLHDERAHLREDERRSLARTSLRLLDGGLRGNAWPEPGGARRIGQRRSTPTGHSEAANSRPNSIGDGRSPGSFAVAARRSFAIAAGYGFRRSTSSNGSRRM